jgi:protein required for attachment to host cells
MNDEHDRRMLPGHLLLLAADASRAHLFRRPERLVGLDEVAAWVNPDARHLTSELVEGRPGRTFDSHGAGRHAIEPKSDAHERSERDFAKLLAGELARHAQADADAALVLVAPPRFLGALRAALDVPLSRRVVVEAGKDLMRLPAAELRHRLAELVAPSVGGG